jgi:hypothetical protein
MEVFSSVTQLLSVHQNELNEQSSLGILEPQLCKGTKAVVTHD